MWQILFLLALLHEPDDHGICRSEVRGRSDPDCKPITIHNGVDTTPGDVLLAGLADAPTTEVTLDGVECGRNYVCPGAWAVRHGDSFVPMQ
jgi:hypothetical protein